MNIEKLNNERQLVFLLKLIALFVAYFVSGKVVFTIGSLHGFAALVWPPAGIAMGALLVGGSALWPAVTLAAFSLNYYEGASIDAALGIALGNTIEPLAGFLLLRRVGFHNSLNRVRDAVWLVFIGASVGPLISATIGVLSLFLFHQMPGDAFLRAWLTWLGGNMFSVLTVTPLLLAWKSTPSLHLDNRARFELGLLYFLAITICILIFEEHFTPTPSIYLLPFVVWSAVRFNVFHVVTLVAVIAVGAIVYTLLGKGPFVAEDLYPGLLQLQASLAVLSISGISLAAAISELRRSDLAVKSANERMDTVLRLAPEGIVLLDRHAKVTYLNQTAAEMIELKKMEDAIGFYFAEIRSRFQIYNEIGELVPIEDTPTYKAFQTKKPHETIVRGVLRGTEKEFWRLVKSVPILDRQGEIETCIIMYHDVTSLKVSEIRSKFLADAAVLLTRSRDYLKTLQTVCDLMVPKFAEWCSIECLHDHVIENIAIAHFDPEKLSMARDFRKRYPAKVSDAGGVARVLRTGKSERYSNISAEQFVENVSDADHLRMVKELRFKSVMIVPMVARNKILGTITFVAGKDRELYTAQDLEFAESLAYRAALAVDNAKLFNDLQEALRMRDEFLSIASHELKTPLTSLLLQLQLLARDAENLFSTMEAESNRRAVDKKHASELLLSALKQSHFLAHLIDELLDLTRIRLGRLELKKEPLNLTEIVREVVGRFRIEYANKGSEIVFNPQREVIGSWDRYRVEQVISNLVSNAVKYGERKPIEVTLNARDHTAQIAIEDHGMGIPFELQGKIFERFERAVSAQKVGGLGLGLYISRQIVEAHKGTIAVESKPGKGSRFTVELPMQA